MARAGYSSGTSRASANQYSYPTFGSAARQSQEQVAGQQPAHFDVIGGKRDQTVEENNAALVIGGVIAVALLVFTLVCIARIALVSATVSLEVSSQSATTELAENRSAASVLEVQDTMLSSTTRIQSAATELEMAAPTTVDQIYLDDDVVATNADGSLSLSESVKRATTASAEE